jgi:hypothetical protein
MVKSATPRRHSGKAPSGNWEAPEVRLAAALGHFVMAWSLVESTIEVAIAKQLRLFPLDSSILTAGLMFQGRANILLSLLNRSSARNTDAISIVKKMQNLGDRNDIMHSVIGGAKSVIWFNRRRTQEVFSSKIEKYDINRLLDAALRCSDLATELMTALGIKKEDYTSFFQDAHNSVSNE